ncbi:MAG: hypothetical protein MI975_10900 [Cytophagales bacterium]|nr:hypothetical protein [Cytophagales bacterium]
MISGRTITGHMELGTENKTFCRGAGCLIAIDLFSDTKETSRGRSRKINGLIGVRYGGSDFDVSKNQAAMHIPHKILKKKEGVRGIMRIAGNKFISAQAGQEPHMAFFTSGDCNNHQRIIS